LRFSPAAGALSATDELEQVAEILDAPIMKPLLGKAAVPDDSPHTTGSIGLFRTEPSQDVIEECDTLFMIGTSFPYIECYPKPGQARAFKSISIRRELRCAIERLGDRSRWLYTRVRRPYVNSWKFFDRKSIDV